MFEVKSLENNDKFGGKMVTTSIAFASLKLDGNRCPDLIRNLAIPSLWSSVWLEFCPKILSFILTPGKDRAET